MIKKVILISIYLFFYGCSGCNSESTMAPSEPNSCLYEVDECGICGGDNSSCVDCIGVPNGDAIEDCLGVCNGNAIEDQCGVCNGDNSSCFEGPTNSLWFISEGNDTWAIYYNADIQIGGFQFKIEGAEIIEFSDGVALENGFAVSASGSMILGFSFTGATLPSGTQKLLKVVLSNTPSAIYEIVISDANSESVEFIFYDSYFTSSLNQTGETHLIIFRESITSLEVGDEIGIFDSNAILNYNNCNNSIGELLVGYGEWHGEQLEIVNIGSIDHCSIGGVQLAGYKSGNPIIIKVWDESEQLLRNTTFTVFDGNETFTSPFTVISELSF